MHTGLLVLLCCLFSTSVDSANILGMVFVPSYSHQVVFQPIWRELSLRGHKVTIITPNPLNDPNLTNLTEIDVNFTYDLLRKMELQNSVFKNTPPTEVLQKCYQLLSAIVEAQLSHAPVQALIKDKTKRFDLVFVEFLNPTIYALGARFNCPLIGITSLGTFLTGYDAVGNPTHPVLSPEFILPFMGKLGFYERLYSTYYNVYSRYYYHYTVLPKLDQMARRYISEDIPYLGDIEKNVSLLFLNVNPILHTPTPNVPAIIQLGKMHIVQKKPLPKVSRENL